MSAASTKPSDDEELKGNSPKARIKRMRARVKKMMDNDNEKSLRKKFQEYIRFIHVPGAQWDDYTKRSRGNERPMFEFNRARVTQKRIINGMRANRPQGKILGYEDNDKDNAEIYSGLLRNIANLSDFDSITDNAAEYQVAGGYAAWRVVTKYSSNTAFDQDILFEGIRNPLCLWCDECAYDMTGKDARDWAYVDEIPTAEYKTRWPNKEPVAFEEGMEDENDWSNENTTRVLEYWWKEPITKRILLLSDGKTIDEAELGEAQGRGLTVVRERVVDCYKIMSAIYSGDAELEGPTEFAGENFPWVRVYGDYLCIDGKVFWTGLTPYIMDAQKAFNLGLTSAYESVARAPLSQIWSTPKQAEGFAQSWAEADKKNLPHQLYNPDPASPGPPVRMGGAEIPVANIQMSQIGAEEIKADSGIFDASLGNKSNETSGVALRAREAQGEIATFNFQDNMAKGVKRTWDIALGLVKFIYDTDRTIRILGEDGAEKFKRINQPDAQGNTLNDLTQGKYDAVITVGPSYSTQRQEATEVFTEMGRANPAIWGVAGDLMLRNMDVPGSDQIAKRLEFMLPPQIQKTLQEGKEIPPEVQQAMMQVEQSMQAVQEHAKMVEAAAGEATQLKTEAEQATAKSQVEKSNIQIAMANLKTEEANFKTMQAQFESQVAQFKADVAIAQAQAEGAGAENSQAIEQINQLAQTLQQQSDAFLQQAAEVMMKASQGEPMLREVPVEIPVPVMVDKPKVVSITSKRQNGKRIGVATYSDGTQKTVETDRDADGVVARINGGEQTIRLSRKNGELVGTQE